MLNLGYGSGSDDDSDAETTEIQAQTVSATSALPSASKDLESQKSTGGLQLPAPTNKSSRRRDGPLKIKVDALLPAENEEKDKPAVKKPRHDETTRGAGASSLVSMLSKLPAPKAAPTAPKPARVLGGGLKNSGDDPGVMIETDDWEGGTFASLEATEDNSASTSFMPASLGKAKAKPAPVDRASPSTSFVPAASKSKPPHSTPAPSTSTTAPSKAAASAVDFFSLGPPSTSRIPSSSVPSLPMPSVAISSAPTVTEYQPPPPSMTDAYPGYYQKPSGDWAAYDPAYYKSFWESWSAEAASGTKDKGKRKDRGWEGADSDNLQSVDALEEMQKSQAAQREATKNLTAAPSAPAAQPKMNIKAKATGGARRKGQLSSLLVEAYENREAIEQRLAEGRRNRKEGGTKYGF